MWHKLSYNTPLSYPLRGKTIYAGIGIPQSDGSVQKLRTCEAGKLDFEGAYILQLKYWVEIASKFRSTLFFLACAAEEFVFKSVPLTMWQCLSL